MIETSSLNWEVYVNEETRELTLSGLHQYYTATASVYASAEPETTYFANFGKKIFTLTIKDDKKQACFDDECFPCVGNRK